MISCRVQGSSKPGEEGQETWQKFKIEGNRLMLRRTQALRYTFERVEKGK
jgi:hypothetical protein